MENLQGITKLYEKRESLKDVNKIKTNWKIEEKKNNSQGITLIALVVTIVVLLILAGITINLLLGNGGIFDIVNQSEIEYEIGALKDRINNVIADWSVERLTKPGVTVDDLWDKMVEADIIDNPDEDVAGAEKEGENDRYELTTNEGYIVEIIISPDGNASIGDITQGEGTGDEEDEIGGATEGLKEGNIIASDPIWSNGTASITLNKGVEVGENLSIQYQVGTTTEENWTTGTTGANLVEVVGLNHNDVVYARLTDGNNVGSYASVTILDGLQPQLAKIELSGTSSTTTGSVTSTLTHIDNESGVDIANCRWVYNTNPSSIGTETSNYPNTFNSNGETITLSASNPETYYLHVLTQDVAGNKIETISQGVTVIQLVTRITLDQTNITLEEGETLQLTATIEPSNASNQSVTWSSNSNTIASVSSAGLVTANSVGTATITIKANDGSNVQATCNVTVNPALPTVEETLKAGNYVRYVDGRGIQRDCVVLYDSNSRYGVEIITMETVENVLLGKDDSTVSGSDDFTKAINSYDSAISTLNNATSKYLNTTYADKVRNVGSVPNNSSYDGAGMFTSSYSYMANYNGKFKNEDNNYLTDWNQMTALNIHDINNRYWLTSRSVQSLSAHTYFHVRYVDDSGNLNGDELFFVDSNDYTGSDSNTNGLRPIFHLKSGLKVTGGNGTSDSPYTLGT